MYRIKRKPLLTKIIENNQIPVKLAVRADVKQASAINSKITCEFMEYLFLMIGEEVSEQAKASFVEKFSASHRQGYLWIKKS